LQQTSWSQDSPSQRCCVKMQRSSPCRNVQKNSPT
jgi:hypothetical protein